MNFEHQWTNFFAHFDTEIPFILELSESQAGEVSTRLHERAARLLSKPSPYLSSAYRIEPAVHLVSWNDLFANAPHT